MITLMTHIGGFFDELEYASREFPGITSVRMSYSYIRFSCQGRTALLYLDYGNATELTFAVSCLDAAHEETRKVSRPLDTRPSLLLQEVYTRLAM